MTIGRSILASLLVAVAVLGSARAAEPITIIAAFDLTGGSAVLDEPSYNGALLAVEEINRQGGLLGRQVELVPVDTASMPGVVAKRIEAALVANPDAVAGLGYNDSTEALAAGRVFQAHGLPFVSTGATDPAVPAEVGDLLFYAAYGDNVQAAAMAAFVSRQLELERVAVWADDSRDYTRTVGRDFAQSFGALGGKIVLRRADDGAADFAAFVAELKTAEPAPQAVYLASMPEDAPDVIRAVRTAGIALPLLSGDGWDADTVVALSKAEKLGGIYFTTHRFLGVDTPATKAFVAAYTARFDAHPPNAFAPLGYDAVGLLADAIRRAGSTDPAAIRDALAATRDFAGVVGEIGYEPGERVPGKAVSVIVVENGVETLRWVAPAP